MTYTTTVAAIHVVDITLVGEPVGGSPKTPLSVQSVTAASDVDLHLSEATGAGVVSTVANAPSTFVITAVDTNGIRVQTGGLKFVVTLVGLFPGETKVLLAQQNRIDTVGRCRMIRWNPF
jgi:hypothetical protein